MKVDSYKSRLISSLKNDIMNFDDSVFEIIMASKKERIKKSHPYAITPPSTEGGRWQTYYKDDCQKRKIIRAQTEDELLEKLVMCYFSESHLDKMTFYELYGEWLEYKGTVTNSSNTIRRHEQHYKKYFEPSGLHQKKVREIDELFLEKECNRIVKEFNMTRKEWGNIKVIINGMFEYAVRSKYIEQNLMEKVRILVKFRQVVKKTGKTETFNSEELDVLNRYLDQMFTETGDAAFLAVKLNFFLGLRVGELVALKWCDVVDDGGHLHIIREEIREQMTNTYQIVEHTKTNRDRFVVLVPKATEILDKIERQGEFLFMRNGERITARQISYVLQKFAQRQGVPVKNTHKMRKTFASLLNAQGVPLDCIRELLGHTELNTTLGYLYNPLTEKETYDLLVKAL